MTMFFTGFSAATFAASGLFFLKFWLASRDKFFLHFCGAFWILAVERTMGAVLFISAGYVESNMAAPRNWLYLLRLTSFALIVVGMIHKNRAKKNRFPTAA